jgi:protein-disulfide isomerase
MAIMNVHTLVMLYPVLKEIMRPFGNNKICFVFRNFPLNDIHPHARHAVKAAEEAAAA